MGDLNQIETIMLHYLQGGISADEMCRLKNWLAESKENKRAFFELKNVYELRKGGLYPGTDEISQSLIRLNKKIDATKSFKKNPSKTRKLFADFYKYAAVAVIFILLTLGIQELYKKDNQLTYNELNVESGPRMSRLTLPDGTKVTLNASTKFKFPDRFGGKVREVFLDGEAFFDVAYNAEIPFVVLSDKQRISVLGTVFNVMDYSSDNYAVTTLVSGSVRLQPLAETETPDKEYILKPNQQAFLNKTTSELTLSSIKIDIDRTWVNKIYHFHEEPLSRIMQRLEKFYGVKIIITDKALKNEKYTGTFQTNKDIEEILKIIYNYNKQFTYTIKNEIITISSKHLKK